MCNEVFPFIKEENHQITKPKSIVNDLKTNSKNEIEIIKGATIINELNFTLHIMQPYRDAATRLNLNHNEVLRSGRRFFF